MPGGEDDQEAWGLAFSTFFVAAWSLPGWALSFVVRHPPLWVSLLSGVAVAPFVLFGWFEALSARSPFVKKIRDDTDFQLGHALLGVFNALSMLPYIALWSSGWERQLHPERFARTTTYLANLVWQAADLVPVLHLPQSIGQPRPPLEVWGLTTGVGLILFDLVLAGSLFVAGRLAFERWRRLDEQDDEKRRRRRP